jgi:hypothetical protein
MKHKGLTVMASNGLTTVHTSSTKGDYWWCDLSGKWLMSKAERDQRLNALVDAVLLTSWGIPRPKALIMSLEVTTVLGTPCEPMPPLRLEVTFTTIFCDGHEGVVDVICVPLVGCVDDVVRKFFDEFNNLQNGNVNLVTFTGKPGAAAIRGLLAS